MGFEVLEQRAPEVDAEVVLDSDVPPGGVLLSTGLALALTRTSSGRARLDVRPEARRGPPVSPEEKLLKAIFGEIDQPVTVAESGPILRGRRLIDTPADGAVPFEAADRGIVGERRDLPGPHDTERVEVDVTWSQAAELGDHVVDARGTVLRIVGFVRPDGEVDVEPWPSMPIAVAVPELPEPLGRRVEDLEVSVRTAVFLERLGATTLGELVVRTEVEILKSGAGRKVLKELKEILAALGLSLGMRVQPSVAEQWVVEAPPDDAPPAAWSAAPLVPPLSLQTPTVRERVIARSIGPYDRLTQRASGGVAVPRTQGEALLAAGGVQLFAELVRRSDDDVGRTQLYEQLLKGGQPERIVGTTRAQEVLDTVLAVLGFGIERRPDGFCLVETALGTSIPVPGIPTPEPTDGPFTLFAALPVRAVRRGPTTATWSYGEVQSAATVDDDGKPIPGGLLCERIFGPVLDYACACGKYKRMKYRGVVCEICGVEVGTSRVRAERMGHIVLRSPGSRGWRVVPVLPPDLRGGTTPAYAAVFAGGDLEPLLAEIGAMVGTVLGGTYRSVDYAGETVVIVDPALSDDGIGGPRRLLADIFRPWVYAELESSGYTTTIKSAKKFVDNDVPASRRVVDVVVRERAVWLGAGDRVAGARIVAVDGGPALRVSPGLAATLGVETGDRVAVHVPLSDAAVGEVRKLRPGTVRFEDGWLETLTHSTRVVETLTTLARTAPIDGGSRAARWLGVR